jgi:hypothetical protein
VAKIIQLRPPALAPAEPRSLHHVVEACVAHLDANASLDDLVAEVHSVIGPDGYDAWARLAFRAVVAAVGVATGEVSVTASARGQ